MKRVVSAIAAIILEGWLHGAEPTVEASALPFSAPTEPGDAQATFAIEANLRIELVASEPLIASPVALSFDENNVLFVVEMRDYSERRDEKLGRVTRLEDSDNDGRMDRATVFADGLPWPTGIFCYGGGVFVMAAPDLWFLKDTNGDGVADERRVVLTGFSELASRLNVQQLPNSLRWGPDQRIHLAEGGNGSRVRRPDQRPDEGLELRGRDLSFDPRTFELRAESGGGQYGMAFDDYGRKFVCSNSRHLMQVAYDIKLAGQAASFLPPPLADIAKDGPAASVFRRSPDEAWRVIRTRWRVSGISPGLIEGGGTASGYFTGATGVQIYRGDRLGEAYHGNAFIADCGSNLIHRKRLRSDGVLMAGERPNFDERREFFAATDNWFRPVQIENGPSGELYVIDFYRETIEHPWSLPPGIKQHLDLNRGNDRGRIWRITHDHQPVRTVRLGESTLPELVEILSHPNGWHRDTAARLLYERNDRDARPLLLQAARSKITQARWMALNLLAARGELDASLIETNLHDVEPIIIERTLQLSAKLSPAINWNVSPWRQIALQIASRDQVSSVGASIDSLRFTLTLVLANAGLNEELTKSLWKILSSSSDDSYLGRAVMALAAPHANRMLEDIGKLQAGGLSVGALANLAEAGTRTSEPAGIARWFQLIADDASLPPEAKPRMLTVLATGAGREPGIAKKLTLSEAIKDQIAESAAKTLSQPLRGGPEDWPTGAFAVVGAERGSRALLPLIDGDAPPNIKNAAAHVLLRFGAPAVFASLVGRWSNLPPFSREQLLAAAIRIPGGMKTLIARAGIDPEFRVQLGPSFRQAARSNPDDDIRRQAVEIFGDGIQATAAQRSKSFSNALTLAGDTARGRVIYLVRCASCHRAGGEGFAVGPDLLSVAGAGRETLLNNILDPNREVAPRFETWKLKLKTGDEATGLLTIDNPQAVTLGMASGAQASYLRAEIASLTSTGRSLMPDGLDEGLSNGGMADLLRFIESLARP